MTKWRQLQKRMATVLITTMVGLTAMPTIPAYAEETPKLKWDVNDDGKWYYFDSNGDNPYSTIEQIGKDLYAFDEDGFMYSDELFENPCVEPDGEPDLYAYPDGRLASTAWVKLDGDGHLFKDYGDPDAENDAYWYFFRSKTAEDLRNGAESMYKNRVKEIGSSSGKAKLYAFDTDGVMYSRQWAIGKYDDKSNDEGYHPMRPYPIDEEVSGKPLYFEAEGQAATDKWLPIGSYWYHFDENSFADQYVSMASSSNAEEADEDPNDYFIMSDDEEADDDSDASPSNAAPARTIESLSLRGSNRRSCKMGESVTLVFDAVLASDSNAKSDGFSADYHDVWASRNRYSGGMKVAYDKSNYTIKITYTPKVEETIQFYVDGIAAETGAVNFVPIVENAAEKKEALNAILNFVGGDLSSTVLQQRMQELYGLATPEQKADLKNVLLSSDKFEQMAASYAMENGIVESTAVTQPALDKLGGGVSIAGAAMNASEDTSLNVDVAETPALKDTYAKTLAFDISLDVDGGDADELVIPVKITMPVPTDFASGSFDFIHLHGDDETKVPYITLTIDGKKYMCFMVDGFSTFVFAKNNTDDGNNGGGHSGGSGGSSTGVSNTPNLTGEWVKDATGWWFKQTSGGYPANSWGKINNKWYYFNAQGYMMTGWVFVSNKWYYLQNEGDMVAGNWVAYNGNWYYLNADGSMAVSTTTPDGYTVNSEGIWVQ